jgi:hypothetical protein
MSAWYGGRARRAARPPGAASQPVLGQRRGLPLGRPPQLLDLAGQLPDTGLQPLVLADKPVNLRTQHGVVTRQPSGVTGPRIALVVPQPHHHQHYQITRLTPPSITIVCPVM